MYSASNAARTGIDKNEIRTVIHPSPLASAEAYLQETGRGSRDGKGAKAWLIFMPEDAPDSGDLRRGAPEEKDVGRSGEAAPEGDSGGPGGPTGRHLPSPQDADAGAAAGDLRAAIIRHHSQPSLPPGDAPEGPGRRR